ncbi:hypothetical protein GCM10009681_19550 [Luedemannella helvata]|uniref:Lipoprotein n=1 Tax=Luedemannella helvata TaxID=349315 RepID=A0ABP4W6Y0_9ACTN
MVTAVAGCGGSAPTPQPSATPAASPRQAARDLLAASAATAKDRRYVATYTLRTRNRDERTVTVALATDNSWVVSVPAGLLGGYADAAVFRSTDGLFQCALGPAAATAADPAAPRVTPGCVKVKKLTSGTDPKVQHIFTDWIDVLLDPAAPFSVAVAQRLEKASGTCYSIESNSAALAAPVDPGIYCYNADGTLTAARTSFGTLVLVGTPDPAPASIALPAPIVPGGPLSVAAPPPPPSPTPGTTTQP